MGERGINAPDWKYFCALPRPVFPLFRKIDARHGDSCVRLPLDASTSRNDVEVPSYRRGKRRRRRYRRRRRSRGRRRRRRRRERASYRGAFTELSVYRWSPSISTTLSIVRRHRRRVIPLNARSRARALIYICRNCVARRILIGCARMNTSGDSKLEWYIACDGFISIFDSASPTPHRFRVEWSGSFRGRIARLKFCRACVRSGREGVRGLNFTFRDSSTRDALNE